MGKKKKQKSVTRTLEGLQVNLMARYPIDFSVLEKGDFIPRTKMEEILCTSADAKGYGLALLRLIEDLMAARPDLVACRHKDGIHILTDEDALVYLAQKQVSGLKRHSRGTTDIVLRVDSTGLSADSEKRKTRNIEVHQSLRWAMANHLKGKCVGRYLRGEAKRLDALMNESEDKE